MILRHKLVKPLLKESNAWIKFPVIRSGSRRRIEPSSVLLDPENNPLHEDNHQLLKLKSDPREDAKGYVATVQHADELTEFLKKHNAS